MLAKRFFYVCAGILCLALAYHFGAQSATAQAPGNPVVGAIPCALTVVTANGDVYTAQPEACPDLARPWRRVANVFAGGGPTPTTQETWGGVKARYRPGASAAPQDK